MNHGPSPARGPAPPGDLGQPSILASRRRQRHKTGKGSILQRPRSRAGTEPNQTKAIAAPSPPRSGRGSALSPGARHGPRGSRGTSEFLPRGKERPGRAGKLGIKTAGGFSGGTARVQRELWQLLIEKKGEEKEEKITIKPNPPPRLQLLLPSPAAGAVTRCHPPVLDTRQLLKE